MLILHTLFFNSYFNDFYRKIQYYSYKVIWLYDINNAIATKSFVTTHNF